MKKTRNSKQKESNINLEPFREIFDRVPHSIFVIDVTDDNRFSLHDFNQLQLEYLNMSRDDIQGRYVDEIFPKDVADLIIGHYKRCLEQGEQIQYEEDVVLPGRGRRHYLTTLSPIKNKNGKIYRLIGSSIEITERKQAEKALSKSEERYRSFVKNSSEGIYLFEFNKPMDLSLEINEQVRYIYEEGYISACNDVMAKMYGYDKSDELVGKDLVELHGSDDNPENIAYLKNVIENDFRIKNQLSVEKDVEGNEVYFMNNVFGIIQNNKLIRVWASQQDVTKQKKAEKALKKSEALQQKMVSNIGDVIVIIDRNGINRYKSPNIEKLFGWKAEELIGKNSFEFIHPDDRDSSQNFMLDLIENPNNKASHEMRYKHKNGSYRWINFTGINLMYDPDVQGILGNYHDITEQKEARQALIREQEFKEALLQTASDGVVACDENGKLVLFNKTAKEWHGVDLKEIPIEEGVKYYDLFHLDGTTRLKPKEIPLVRAFKGEVLEDVGMAIVPIGESPRYILASGSPVFDKDGKQLGAVVLMHDITEKKEIEKEIKASLQEKETLLAEIHHRVKNNLAVVSGMMQLQAYDSSNKEFQNKLFDSVNRIKTMASVHELLYQSNSFTRLDFSDTITKLIENISETLQTSTQINLNIDCDHIKLNINKAVPASLIVNEVVTNIYKHAFIDMPEGKIDFQVKQQEDKVFIQVRDNGIGIDKENAKESSSLGMLLIRELSNQIEGEYEYHKANPGTKFTLTFKI